MFIGVYGYDKIGGKMAQICNYNIETPLEEIRRRKEELVFLGDNPNYTQKMLSKRLISKISPIVERYSYRCKEVVKDD